MNWILMRIMEPSTWAGLATLATGAAVAMPDMADAFHIVVFFAGALAVGIAEKGKTNA